ncbi:hypothetical protein [Sphingopyxis sp.]|uniref:hypothetical protein n=1 Tax=Sphingopyxis sp. TaxID=1908224 RepID=UPI0035B11080
MKKILTGAVAAIALAGAASPAAAQTHENHYAGALVVGTATNPTPGLFTTVPANIGVLAGVGTRYTADTIATGDVGGAAGNVSVAFHLSGTVNKDCSFYAGNGGNAQNLDFGTIGVRTGNNVNVNDAFDMVADATAVVTSATAGCNFKNDVKITKDNIAGMVNTATGLDYDNSQFQANIPYRVDAAWTGVDVGEGSAPGHLRTLSVATNAVSGTKAQGAWRSGMVLTFYAPAADKALVAGEYEGTTTLTLTAAL